MISKITKRSYYLQKNFVNIRRIFVTPSYMFVLDGAIFSSWLEKFLFEKDSLNLFIGYLISKIDQKIIFRRVIQSFEFTHRISHRKHSKIHRNFFLKIWDIFDSRRNIQYFGGAWILEGVAYALLPKNYFRLQFWSRKNERNNFAKSHIVIWNV